MTVGGDVLAAVRQASARGAWFDAKRMSRWWSTAQSRSAAPLLLAEASRKRNYGAGTASCGRSRGGIMDTAVHRHLLHFF
jgi:hypothetical protein